MTKTPIDRMYDALANGDVAAVKACFTPDARIWHSFDRIEQDVAAAAQDWAALIAHSQARSIADVHRHMTASGLVQQHLFLLRTTAGELKAWPVCLVVNVQDDRIARIDEYIDRAGSFAPDEDAPITPGFRHG